MKKKYSNPKINLKKEQQRKRKRMIDEDFAELEENAKN